MITKRILLIATIIIFFLTLFGWRGKTGFKQNFGLSMPELQSVVNREAAGDFGLVALKPTRFFHNKISYLFFRLIEYYIVLIDFDFLIPIISLAGTLGFYLGCYFLIKDYGEKGLLLLTSWFLLIYPYLILIFSLKIVFIWKVILIALPYQLLSIFGFLSLEKIFNSPRQKLLFSFLWLVLILLSVGWRVT
jgi:hypothetical protein